MSLTEMWQKLILDITQNKEIIMAEERKLILQLGQKITDRIGHKVTVEDPEYYSLRHAAKSPYLRL